MIPTWIECNVFISFLAASHEYKEVSFSIKQARFYMYLHVTLLVSDVPAGAFSPKSATPMMKLAGLGSGSQLSQSDSRLTICIEDSSTANARTISVNLNAISYIPCGDSCSGRDSTKSQGCCSSRCEINHRFLNFSIGRRQNTCGSFLRKGRYWRSMWVSW